MEFKPADSFRNCDFLVSLTRNMIICLGTKKKKMQSVLDYVYVQNVTLF